MAIPENPITRKETFLAKAAGQDVPLPEGTLTREEAYLRAIAENGGGGGTGDGDMKKSVYDKNNNGIVDNAEKVNNHTVEKDVPADAVFTDTVYDDTELSGRVTDVETEKADRSELPDVATASEVGLTKPDGVTTEVDENGVISVIGGVAEPYDGKKVRYTISSSGWSSSPNSSGYYTYSLTLDNALTTATSPNVYIAGSTDNTEPTATERTMFGYVKRCNLSSSTTLVLYATTKPTSNFYVFVGAEGGMVSAKHVYSTTEQVVGEWIDGSDVYEKTFNLNTAVAVSTNWTRISSIVTSAWKAIINVLGITKEGYCHALSGAGDSGYLECISPVAFDSDIKTLIVRYTKQ